MSNPHPAVHVDLSSDGAREALCSLGQYLPIPNRRDIYVLCAVPDLSSVDSIKDEIIQERLRRQLSEHRYAKIDIHDLFNLAGFLGPAWDWRAIQRKLQDIKKVVFTFILYTNGEEQRLHLINKFHLGPVSMIPLGDA